MTPNETLPTTLPAQMDAPPREPLALRPREAAKLLGIGRRLLWQETNAGRIPHLRIGRCILYPVASLQQMLADRAAKSVRR